MEAWTGLEYVIGRHWRLEEDEMEKLSDLARAPQPSTRLGQRRSAQAVRRAALALGEGAPEL